MSKHWHKNPSDSRNWTDTSSPVYNNPANPFSPAGRAAAKKRAAKRAAKSGATAAAIAAPPAPSAPWSAPHPDATARRGVVDVPSRKACQACGGENRAGAQLCRDCGQTLDRPRRAPGRPAGAGARPGIRSKRKAAVTLVMLLVVALLIAGVAALPPGHPSESSTSGSSGASVRATVVAGGSFIRNDPSTNQSRVGTVPGNATVRIVCRVGPPGTGWYRLGGKHKGHFIGGSRLVQPPAVPSC